MREGKKKLKTNLNENLLGEQEEVTYLSIYTENHTKSLLDSLEAACMQIRASVSNVIGPRGGSYFNRLALFLSWHRYN